MTLLYLIRHGHVSVQDPDHPDPELDALGLHQAQDLAARLSSQCAPLPILSSPLRRCQQTAAALADQWSMPVMVDARLTEVPSPMPPSSARSAWLHDMLTGTWSDMARRGDQLEPGYATRLMEWQTRLLDVIDDTQTDSLLCTHFFAVNWLNAVAQGNDQVAIALPDHASITLFRRQGHQLILLCAENDITTNIR